MGQGEKGIESVTYALKIGKLNPSVLPYIEQAQLIEVTGWTPEELGKIDAELITVYKIIWSAKGTTTRQERRELSGIG